MTDLDVGKIPLSDETIREILIYREAHFGGSFEIMNEYYTNHEVANSADFNKEDVILLQQIELKLEQNLAPLILTEFDNEEIEKAKASYVRLREVYETKDQFDLYPKLIADLILSEQEDPHQEIQAIVKEGQAIVPYLVELSFSEEFKNPLHPGFGRSPLLAIKCLGMIGNDRAIMTLFEQIGRAESVQDEEDTLIALKTIGTPAKKFLLKILKSKPITEDNERAAIALIHFKEDHEVAEAAFELLQKEEVRKILPLAAYLVLDCEGLQKESERQQFEALAKHPKTPSILEIDFKTVLKAWKNFEKMGCITSPINNKH